MRKFVFTVTMGNDAMQTAEDVADAMHRAAYRLEQYGESGTVFDDNGNRVGSYGFEEDRPKATYRIMIQCLDTCQDPDTYAPRESHLFPHTDSAADAILQAQSIRGRDHAAWPEYLVERED